MITQDMLDAEKSRAGALNISDKIIQNERYYSISGYSVSEHKLLNEAIRYQMIGSHAGRIG